MSATAPLLDQDEDHRPSDIERLAPPRPPLRRFHTDPAKRDVNRSKMVIVGVALVLVLVTFTVQTELAAYIQADLGWSKPFMMMYVTHSSWLLIFPLQLLYVRLRQPSVRFRVLYRAHVHSLITTAQSIHDRYVASTQSLAYNATMVTLWLALSLNVAASTWYVAVNLTTPSDLSAIYNASAFFAYAWSIVLLGEAVRWDKVGAVILSIVGVVIVAYGGVQDHTPGHEVEASKRLIGNVIIAIGSVGYGLYEVLYKRMACPPADMEPTPRDSIYFSNAVAASIGLATLLTLWITLPLFHYLGIEIFEWPSEQVWLCLVISMVANFVFTAAFLTMVSLTNPVLSSVAALLSIFVIALTDMVITGKPLTRNALLGGFLIIVAFGVLAAATWRELTEQEEGSDDSDE
ncbi:hypothetical protein YB2330_002662 [Saitoella coloradoensis]